MLYFYKAITEAGRRRIGLCTGRSRAFVFRLLLTKKLYPKTIFQLYFFKPRIKVIKPTKEYILLIFKRIYAAIEEGQTFIQALRSINGKEKSIFVSRCINEMESGKFFYEIIAKQSDDVLSRDQLRLLQCAELGGYLRSAIGCIIEQLELQKSIRKQIVSNITYPALVLLFCMIALFVISGFVLPNLKQFVNTQELSPWISVFFNIVDGIRPFLLIFALIFIFFIFKPNYLIKFFEKLPFYGWFTDSLHIGMFALSLSSLLKHGISLIESLELSTGYLNNKFFDYSEVLSELNDGKSFSYTVRNLPEFFVESVKTAEIGGQLVNVLNVLSKHYLKTYEDRLKQFTEWIEPGCIIFLAILILSVAICFFIPIFNLVDAFEF